MEDLRITEGVQSLNECREGIKFHAMNIAIDCSSTMVNKGRIDTMRILLDLFEEYNMILSQEEKNKS